MAAAMTTIQTETHRKRKQSQHLQDQKVQAIVVQHGNSLLAKALVARLRRRQALTLRQQPRRAAQDASISNRLYMPHLRIQKDTKQVKQMLSAIVQGGEAKRWLAAPNAMLGGARPVDKIRQGKTRQVIELLTTIQEGIYV